MDGQEKETGLGVKIKAILAGLSKSKEAVLEGAILERAEFLDGQDEYALEDFRRLTPLELCRVIKAVNSTVRSCDSKINRIFEQPPEAKQKGGCRKQK